MQSSRKHNFWWGPEYSHSLFVRSCGEFVLVPPDRERIRSTVDFGEIFWPVSGQCAFYSGEKKYILRPGYAWYYPPGSRQDYKPLSPFHYCWMTIAGDETDRFFSLLGITPGLNKAGICPQQLFSSLGKDCTYHSTAHRINALTTAFKILLQIYFPEQAKANIGNSAMEYAKTLIESSFDDPDLSPGQIAEVLHMHRASFSRAFSQTYAQTASSYISSVRLKNAAEKLSASKLAVKDVAKTCGFSSANYFSKVFIKQYGVSPEKYRKHAVSETDSE